MNIAFRTHRPSPATIVALIAVIAATTGTAAAESGGRSPRAAKSSDFQPSARGTRGPRGLRGLAGVRGPTGLQGPAGPIGSAGPRGSAGPQGPAGANGLSSATEIYKNGPIAGIGTTGTTVATLANLAPGAYVVSAKAQLTSSAALIASCTLAAGTDTDVSEADLGASQSGTLPNQLTHTFSTMGVITLSCKASAGTIVAKNVKVTAVLVNSESHSPSV
jgi:hypothetical protein